MLGIPETVGQRDLLHDDAMWDMPHWVLVDDVADEIGLTIETLGEMLDQGFIFMATWVTSSVLLEFTLPAPYLASLIRRGRINEFTRYRVAPKRSRPTAER